MKKEREREQDNILPVFKNVYRSRCEPYIIQGLLTSSY